MELRVRTPNIITLTPRAEKTRYKQFRRITFRSSARADEDFWNKFTVVKFVSKLQSYRSRICRSRRLKL